MSITFYSKFALCHKFIGLIFLSIGSSLAIFIAETLGLEYSTSAGIITFLTVQDTKRETLNLAIKRLLSYFVTILLAMIFLHGAYDYVKFGLFMLCLVGVSYVAGWSGAISVNAVIGTPLTLSRIWKCAKTNA